MKSAVLKRTLLPAVAVVLSLGGTATESSAQACLGSPARQGQTTIAGMVGFPEEARQYGGGLMYNLAGPLAVFGAVSVLDTDAEGVNSVTSFSGGAAFDVAAHGGTAAAGVSVCPNLSIGYSSFKQNLPFVGQVELSQLAVPIGLGFGSTVPLGDGATSLTPWANPQLVYSRFSGRAMGESETDSDTYFAVAGGASIGFSRVFVGALASKVFEEGHKAVIGVQAGFIF